MTIRVMMGSRAIWLALAAALVLAACSGDSGVEEAAAPATTTPATTTTAATTTTTAVTNPGEAAVLAAYRAFWNDMIAVGATANWRSPRIDDHATGQVLLNAQATYRSLNRRGLVARGTVKVRAKVLSIKGNKATVYDCNSTSNFLAYDAATGELRDESSGQSNGMTVTLVRTNGVWKVAKEVTEVGKCTK
jgi:PBP1b-binding outer membrane lipoprotein LpoB